MSKETEPNKGTIEIGVLINAIPLKKVQKWAKRWEKKQVHNRKLNAAEDDFYEFTQSWSLVCNTNSPIQL
jgi:hypothetical protein